MPLSTIAYYSAVLALAVPAWTTAVPNPPTLPQAKRAAACNNAPAHTFAVKTTTHSTSGQLIDWIPLESQGPIATPPTYPGAQTVANLTALLGIDGELRGPPGTVPVFRTCAEPLAKVPPPTRRSNRRAKRDQDVHLYAASTSRTTSWGGFGTFNAWNIGVEQPDFSLIQTAIINDQATSQTLETGLVKYPNFYGDNNEHIFSFFTTNNYQSSGDNIGGWDMRQKGYIQYDTSIAPGVPVGASSVDGGTQYEVELGYQLYQGNWWLYVGGKYIGYYPASLFSAGRDASTSLASHATVIDFYGEVFDSASNPGLTTTDMGSGKFPSAGITHAAYLRKLRYINNAAATTTADYNGSGGDVVTTPSSYLMNTFWSVPSDPFGDAGSYLILGGPGSH